MPLKVSNSDELPAINLTSMIDVLFLLIIFFMVGTRFAEKETPFQINLPKTSNPNPMMQKPASLAVKQFPDGALEFEGRIVTPQELTSLLASRVNSFPDTAVQFRPDGDSKASQNAVAYAAITSAGVRNIQFMTATAQMPSGIRR